MTSNIGFSDQAGSLNRLSFEGVAGTSSPAARRVVEAHRSI